MLANSQSAISHANRLSNPARLHALRHVRLCASLTAPLYALRCVHLHALHSALHSALHPARLHACKSLFARYLQNAATLHLTNSIAWMELQLQRAIPRCACWATSTT
jgi:hypothetical protein